MNIFNYTRIQHLQSALVGYVMDGQAVGGFLQAVIAGELYNAVSRADSQNVELIPIIVAWVYGNAPAAAWGSQEKLHEWQSANGYSGRHSTLLDKTTLEDNRRRLNATFQSKGWEG
jgi:hypothetical protein